MNNYTIINTAQNVNINYNLAETSQRIWAFILDKIILSAYITILLVIMVLISANNQQFFNTETNFGIFFTYLLLLILPYIFYNLLFPYFMQGQTLGKRIVGIRIVKEDGGEAGFGTFFVRWLLNLVDFYLVSTLVGLIVMVCTQKRQRIADLVASTVVINVKKIKVSQRPDFERLAEEYHPTFMQVLLLSDNDVRIIRQSFDRARRNGNAEILQKLREKIETITTETAPEMSAEQFIDTVLRDYKYFAGQ
ncbi:MAG: RDD family protein [Prevotellaceae bacterium]|jgi:uncharacterized RDD family membrane protein YckC|nr:RDD family protein [Prevotellaceae bacterium]